MPPRPLYIRLTHWLNALTFLALLISGIAILIAHPRLYWGETGSLQTPSLLDLPLPFLLNGQNGWGRSLHFLAAWAALANGLVYLSTGLRRNHFQSLHYPRPQRLAYSAVIFLLFPAIIWSGLAMSPALTAVFPALVTTLGGHQSARTLHFFLISALVLFFLGHVSMVALTGFARNLRGMISGKDPA